MSQEFNDIISQYETACHNLNRSLKRLTEVIRSGFKCHREGKPNA